MDALRAADGALHTPDEIAGRMIEVKGFDATDVALRGSIRDQALAVLRSYRKRQTVEQIGPLAAQSKSFVVNKAMNSKPSSLNRSAAPSRRSTIVITLTTLQPSARTALTAFIAEEPEVVTSSKITTLASGSINPSINFCVP
jgi:hypothetical protein